MAKQETTCDDILKELRAKQYRPVYYLMGEESYYIDLISDYIVDNVLTDTEKEFTLTVAYLSDDEYRRRYELDLVKEMARQRKGNKIAVVYNHDCEGIEELADYPVQIKVGADMENVLLGLDFILFAQTIALMKSLSLGITPDNPCPTGEVNRVVKGVTLYPYTLK